VSVTLFVPVATGMEEHRRNALDYFEATKWIKQNLPLAKVSGGVSNVSFSFRGNDLVREAIHAAFLYHGIICLGMFPCAALPAFAAAAVHTFRCSHGYQSPA